ncbi:MAG: ClpX C4-type zinc finger protein, partial [Planctomycetota bacterium]
MSHSSLLPDVPDPTNTPHGSAAVPLLMAGGDDSGGPTGPTDGGDSGDSGGSGGSGAGGSGGGGFRGRKVTTCSFCGKTSREVGPMVEGPSEVYICSKCVDLCQNIFRQERRRVSSVSNALSEIPSPSEIKGFLDQYVIGQHEAKRTLAVAVHNHYKRVLAKEEGEAEDDDVELQKSNILMIGPS